jgi:hypothetical protein
MLLELQGSC